MHASTKTYQIIIIGAGPVGLSLANLLAPYGIAIAVFEKSGSIYPSPRAVHIDDETVRIFQAMGILPQLQAFIEPFEHMQFISAKGKLLYQMCLYEGKKKYGHHPANWFLQPELEKILRQNLAKYPLVDLFLNQELIAIQDKQLLIKNLVSKQTASYWATYVIGCDGGKSAIRNLLKIPFQNLQFDQKWMVVDAFLKSPTAIDLLPTYHQQICNPKRPVTYVPGVKLHRRFEFMLLPNENETTITQAANVAKLIRPFIAPEKLTIQRATVYSFHGLIAETWQQNNFFLAGDAAHLMPPFAGQGMCSGIRDAHNLAWKLAAVLTTNAPTSLLQTYQAERQTHVTEMAKGAINIGKLVQTRNPVIAQLRNMQFFLARHIPFIAQIMQKDSLRKRPYERGMLGKKHVLAGQLMIQPLVQNLAGKNLLLDELLGNSWAMLHLTPALAYGKWMHILLEKNGIKFVNIMQHFKEENGQLTQWFYQQKISFVVIRPDRYIFDAGKAGEEEEVLKNLDFSPSQNELLS